MSQKFSEIILKLRNMRKMAFDSQAAAEISTLPVYVSAVAAMNMRKNTWKGLFFTYVGLSVILLCVVKCKENVKETVVIVPGAPEFARVAPNQIPEESVFNFAEYVASHVGSFSYRNVKYHFSKIMNFMSPLAASKFQQNFESKLKDWQERRVEQGFAYEPVKVLNIDKDKFGTKYVVAVKGTRVQHVEGHVFSETRDVLLLAFRTRAKLTPEHPFIFEVESLEWFPEDTYESYKNEKFSNGEVSK